MTQIPNPKPNKYDLESRTEKFAQRVIEYTEKLPKTLANIETSKQLIRASGSVGANYIEANESLGKKDFMMKVKKGYLIQDSTELMKIFGSILENSE
jgi:hypothetical protein